MSRYSGFYRKLLSSPSREVRVLERMLSSDPISATFSNLKLTGLVKPQFFSSARVRMELPVKKVPEAEQWRTGLMDT